MDGHLHLEINGDGHHQIKRDVDACPSLYDLSVSFYLSIWVYIYTQREGESGVFLLQCPEKKVDPGLINGKRCKTYDRVWLEVLHVMMCLYCVARSQDIVRGSHGAVGLVTPGHHNLWAESVPQQKKKIWADLTKVMVLLERGLDFLCR